VQDEFLGGRTQFHGAFISVYTEITDKWLKRQPQKSGLRQKRQDSQEKLKKKAVASLGCSLRLCALA
jgi:hypothetical protein